MPRESVLTTADRNQIRIEKLIFHIILKDELQPRYLDEVDITEEQRSFFRDRLSDAATTGRQFVFLNDSSTKVKSSEIINCNNERFVQLSKELAADFRRHHGANTNNGVFIVSVASIGARKLVFLIKFDHKKIYQYQVQDGRALLREVQDTFSEDKSSIQKVALIDVGNTAVWDVLVTDVAARPDKDYITDYFKNFLGVTPRETDTDLTLRALRIAFNWAATQNDLPETQEASDYKSRAKAYLLGNSNFDSEAFINAVVLDEDAARLERHRNSLKQRMEDEGLYGQNFTLIHSALKRNTTKNVRLTQEGIRIEWEGSAEDVNYSVGDRDENGQQTITIKTGGITQLQ